jgi:hypothetical protein
MTKKEDLDQASLRESVHQKMLDMTIPGFVVEFDPDEAEFAGAFEEDALSEEDAYESAFDLPDLSDNQ